MRYQVPQFIEVEDKIFGPFTFRQFVYLSGGVGFVVILYTFLPVFFVVILGGPILIVSLALAFFKVNNRPFVNAVEAFMRFTLNKKLYLWKKKEKEVKRKTREEQAPVTPHVPKLSDSKLKDLAWSLDIKESLYAGTNNQQK